MRETTEGLAGTRAKQGSGKRPELSFWLRHSLRLLLDSAVLGLQGSYPRNGRRALDPRGLAWNGWLRALPTRLPMERDFTPSVIAVDPQERRGKKGCKFLEELQIGNLKRPAVTLRVQLNGPCKNASSHVWPLLHAYTGHSKFTHYSILSGRNL